MNKIIPLYSATIIFVFASLDALTQPMPSISAGVFHSLFLDEQGFVWSAGQNQKGQLGHGDTKNRLTPAQINGVPQIKAIAAGTFHSLLLDEEGFVWSVGYNEYGQLGLGDTIDRSKPERIEGVHKIKAIATGWSHSLFLDEEGSVWSVGDNRFGQLGHGDTIDRSLPARINGVPKIKAIAAGYAHSLLLDEDGFVWNVGYNEYGQLGHGDTIYHQDRPKRIDGVFQIKAIAAGCYHSLFLDEEGSVWSVGNNSSGQLGHGDTIYHQDRPKRIDGVFQIKAIAAGRGHSLLLDEEGFVWSFGCSLNGPLRNEYGNYRSSPARIDGLSQIIAIAAGDGHSLFLEGNGEVMVVGFDSLGQAAFGIGYTPKVIMSLFQIISKVKSAKSSLLPNESPYTSEAPAIGPTDDLQSPSKREVELEMKGGYFSDKQKEAGLEIKIPHLLPFLGNPSTYGSILFSLMYGAKIKYWANILSRF